MNELVVGNCRVKFVAGDDNSDDDNVRISGIRGIRPTTSDDDDDDDDNTTTPNGFRVDLKNFTGTILVYPTITKPSVVVPNSESTLLLSSRFNKEEQQQQDADQEKMGNNNNNRRPQQHPPVSTNKRLISTRGAQVLTKIRAMHTLAKGARTFSSMQASDDDDDDDDDDEDEDNTDDDDNNMDDAMDANAKNKNADDGHVRSQNDPKQGQANKTASVMIPRDDDDDDDDDSGSRGGEPVTTLASDKSSSAPSGMTNNNNNNNTSSVAADTTTTPNRSDTTKHQSFRTPLSSSRVSFHGLDERDENNDPMTRSTMASMMAVSVSAAASNTNDNDGGDDNSNSSSDHHQQRIISCPLHTLCARSDVSLWELQEELQRNPSAASTPDWRGKLPLHILSENHALFLWNPNKRKQTKKKKNELRQQQSSTPSPDEIATMRTNGIPGIQVAHEFCLDLMAVYPEGIVTKDDDDHIPFVHNITSWIHDCYDDDSATRQSLRDIIGDSSRRIVSSVIRRRHHNTPPPPQTSVSAARGGGGGDLLVSPLGMDDIGNSNHTTPATTVASPTNHADDSMRGNALLLFSPGTPQMLSPVTTGRAPAPALDPSTSSQVLRTPPPPHQGKSGNGRTGDTASLATAATSGGLLSQSSGRIGTSSRCFPGISITPIAEWSFEMLNVGFQFMNGSVMMPHNNDASGGGGGLKRFSRKVMRSLGAAMAQNVASIPFLIKTLLLMEDVVVRQYILDLPMMRRVLLRAETLTTKIPPYFPRHHRPWLVTMIRKSGMPARHAVDYLVMVSNLTIDDFVGTAHGGSGLGGGGGSGDGSNSSHMTRRSAAAVRTPRSSDWEAYEKERTLLLEAVESMENMIPSLIVMEDRLCERAASTDIVWKALSRSLSQPFVVAVVMTDFLLHVTLMLAYRNAVSPSPIPDDEVPNTFYYRRTCYDLPKTVVAVIAFHFFCQKATQVVLLAGISLRVSRHYFLDFWTLVDICTLGFCMGTVGAIGFCEETSQRAVWKGVALGFLYLKLLGFLRVLNVQLATFTLSLIKVIYDLRWFMLIVTATILAFGDMFHVIVTGVDDGILCQEAVEDENEATEDFCEGYLTSYLRVWTLLLGDFELHTYTVHPAVQTLFVIFTILGFILILNILIALVSNSYERSRLFGKNLFGRARVTFAISHLTMGQLYNSSYNKRGSDGAYDPNNSGATNSSNNDEEQSPMKRRIAGLASFIRWSELLVMILTAVLSVFYLFLLVGGEAYSISVTQRVIAGLTGTVLLLAVAFIMQQMIRVSFTSCTRPGNCMERPIRSCGNFFDSLGEQTVGRLSNFLFGLENHEADQSEVEDAWNAKVHVITTEMERIVATAERNLKEALREVEHKLQEIQSDS